MLSSHTLNAATSPLQLLENSLTALDSNVSLDERITLTEAFIYTALSTLEGREGSGELVSSISRVVIPTLALLVEHRKRVGIMRARMVMFAFRASTDPESVRAEEAMAELVTSGLRSRVRAIESRFGIWSMNWIQRARLVLSPNFKSTVTGSSLLCLPSMVPQTESVSPEEMLMDEMIGYRNLVLQVERHS